jgi:hypothetical protein
MPLTNKYLVGSPCYARKLVIMKGNSKVFVKDLDGENFKVVFGRSPTSDVVFEKPVDASTSRSIHDYTSMRHATLFVDMQLPSRPVFTLRDDFGLRAGTDKEYHDAEKATEVYREDGQLREKLISPERTATVESCDILHFLPSYSRDYGGNKIDELKYSIFVSIPDFDAKIPPEPERCPDYSSLIIYRNHQGVLQITDYKISKVIEVLFGHGENVSNCPRNCLPVVFPTGRVCTRTKAEFKPCSRLRVVVKADEASVEMTVLDDFEEEDPVRYTAVYKRDGTLRVQLNPRQRSARVFEDDVLVFENDLQFSYGLGLQSEWE